MKIPVVACIDPDITTNSLTLNNIQSIDFPLPLNDKLIGVTNLICSVIFAAVSQVNK